MTISNQTNRISAVGSGSTGQEVPFSFPITDSGDLTVFKRVTATAVETTLAETTNYTVSISGDTGGTLTTVTTIETTEEIHLVRTTPFTQAIDLEAGGSYSAEDIENGFDKATKLSIDNKDSLDRALRAPATDSISLDLEIPNSVDRASKNLGFDASGNVTVTDSSGNFTTTNAFWDDIVTKSPWYDGRASGLVGDGATDDGPAMILALTAVPDGGVLFLPAGNYLLTTFSVQTITKNIWIKGQGPDNTIITGPNASTDFIRISTAGNIKFTGIGFSTFESVIDNRTAIAQTTDFVIVDDCKFDSIGHGYTDLGATVGSLTYFSFRNCRFDTIAYRAIRMRSLTCTYASVRDCTFDTIGLGIGIWLGSDSTSMANGTFIVKNNYFKDITAAGGADTHAIILFGDRVIVEGNAIDTVSNADGTDCEGIYTKASHSIIANNTIIDGGKADSSILVKGAERDEVGPTNPNGFANVITGNSITFSTEYTYDGITCAVDSTLVCNNYVENAETAIGTSRSDTDIHSNTFYNCARGVVVAAGTAMSNISVVGNNMRNIGDSADVSAARGIHLNASDASLTNILISNNLVSVVESSGSTAAGIDMDCDEGISNVLVNDNMFYSMTQGIRVDLGGGALASLLISNNLFREISATAIDSDAYADAGNIIHDNVGSSITRPAIVCNENQVVCNENQVVYN